YTDFGGTVFLLGHRDRHPSPLLVIYDGVMEEIAESAANQFAVSRQKHTPGTVERDTMLLDKRAIIFPYALNEFADTHFFRFQSDLVSVAPAKEQEAFDQ